MGRCCEVCGKGTNKFHRAYVEVKKSNVKEQ